MGRYYIEQLESRTLLSATDLDPSFGNNGIFRLDTQGAGIQGVVDQAVQADGKTLTVGFISGGGNYLMLVRRINTDGTLDSSFGNGGTVRIAYSSSVYGAAISVGSDGKIAALGFDSTSSNLVIARLLPTGTLDPAFGTNGIVVATSNSLTAEDVVIGPDDKITYMVSNPSFGATLVSRLTATGAVDTGFGTSGTTAFGNGSFAGFEFQPTSDGHLFIAGSANFIHQMALAELNPNGTPTAIGTNGVLAITTTPPVQSSTATAMLIQGDGKLVLAGNNQLVRLNTNLTPDSTFGTGGVYTASSFEIRPRDVFQLSSGSYAVAGEDANNVVAFVATSAGATDTSFNSTGRITMGGMYVSQHPSTRGTAMVISAGKILIAGMASGSFNPELVRLNLNGTADTSFGPSGTRVFVDLISGNDAATVLWPQPDGSVLVGATTAQDGSALYRLLADGSVDTSFGSGGRVVTPSAVTGLATLADGRIYVGSQAALGSSTYAIRRLMPNGALDSTWGTNGVVTTTTVQWLGLDPTNNDVLIAANTLGTNIQVNRFLPTGNVDTSYGNNGAFNASDDVFWAAAVGPDGSVVVVGTLPYYSSNFDLLRVDNTGHLDTSFGGTGVVAPFVGQARKVVVLGDGRVVAVGSGVANNTNVFTVARFLTNGSLDTSFNGTGSVVIGGTGFAASVAVEGDGKLIVGGTANGNKSELVRINTDGTLDPTFGVNGELPGNTLNPLAIDRYGRILTGGSISDRLATNGTDLVVSRMQGDVGASITTSPAGGDTVALELDPDHLHVDWTRGSESGEVLAAASSGLTINASAGTNTITLNYSNGNPFPAIFHLNGSFTINGLSGTNPFAGTVLEIGQSTVYVNYANGPSPAAAIFVALQSGCNAGGWNGSGAGASGAIASAVAASGPAGKYGIGYADSADGVVNGQPANTVEIRYTLMADANLDGTVNGTDALALGRNYLVAGKTAWDLGNFNYDSTINLADAAFLQKYYNATVTAAAVGAAAGTGGIALAASPTPSIVSSGSSGGGLQPVVSDNSSDLSSDTTGTAPIGQHGHRKPRGRSRHGDEARRR